MSESRPLSALVAQAAIALANQGALAVGVMGGLVVALAGLAFGASIIGPALTAGAVGFVAFGAAMVLVGAGMALAAGFIKNLVPLVKQVGDRRLHLQILILHSGNFPLPDLHPHWLRNIM